MDPKPNPGSNEARILGCKCPVLDNSHGHGYMGMEGVFVMRADCPMHGDQVPEEGTSKSAPIGDPE